MKKIIFGLLFIGLTIQSFAQVIVTLPEIEITATNYKYLSSAGFENASLPVETLERKVASFDLENADFYSDEYDTYEVSFYLPDGYILASYDKDGNILRTAERFKNVKLPRAVIESVAKTYPNWAFTEDVYKVSYYESGNTGNITKKYKITLENNDKKIKVKVDENGNFL